MEEKKQKILNLRKKIQKLEKKIQRDMSDNWAMMSTMIFELNELALEK